MWLSAALRMHYVGAHAQLSHMIGGTSCITRGGGGAYVSNISTNIISELVVWALPVLTRLVKISSRRPNTVTWTDHGRVHEGGNVAYFY